MATIEFHFAWLTGDLDLLIICYFTCDKRYERLPTAHWSATSWSTQPPFGTPTLKKKHSSWKKFNAGQHGGPLAISTTGQALLLP